MGSDAGNCYPQQTLCSLGTLKQLITEEQDTHFKTQGYLLLSMHLRPNMRSAFMLKWGWALKHNMFQSQYPGSVCLLPQGLLHSRTGVYSVHQLLQNRRGFISYNWCPIQLDCKAMTFSQILSSKHINLKKYTYINLNILTLKVYFQVYFLSQKAVK